MRKGDLVKLSKSCFTTRNGGTRDYPLSNHDCDGRRVVMTHRPVTESERAEWRNSDASKGMNSAGETKLPPTCVGVEIHADDNLIVERSRCRVRLGWGNATPGMVKVFNARTGESSYLKRGLVIPA